jgi:serine/threonine protein kinase
MITGQTEQSVVLNIPRDVGDYRLSKAIGQGSNSVVVKATNQSNGKDFAIKVMSLIDIANRNLTNKVEREIRIHQSLVHENVCRFHEVIRENNLIFIVLDYCDCGDLLSWIMDGNFGRKEKCLRLFKQIAEGIRYLHERGLSHGDIKPENVILDDQGNAKLIDFGFVKDTMFGDDEEKSGTFIYAAPELFKRGSFHTQKSDIWSLGIVLYCMLTGSFPYPTGNQRMIAQYIQRGQLLYPQGMDRDIETLLRRLTNLNPNERPTIQELVDDPIFDCVDSKPQKSNRSTPLLEPTEIEDELDADFWSDSTDSIL